MQFKSLLYFASVVAVALGATVQDVLNDLNTVRTRTTTLDNAIRAFPDSGGSLVAALAIHNDATSVQSAVDTTTTAAKAVTPSPVSVTDGTSVLNSVNAIKPIIEDALIAIVAKKPAFDALPLGGIPALVKQDLSNLSASTTALENALIASTPSSLLSQAQAVKAEIDAAFAKAIAAYA